MQRKLLLKLVKDNEFKDSFWSYDLSAKIQAASEEFKKQFGVKFKIIEVQKWDSCGCSRLESFPDNVIRSIPNTIPVEDIPTFLIGTIKEEMKLSLGSGGFQEKEFSEKIVGAFRDNDHSKTWQYGYLSGYLYQILKQCLMEDLKRKFRIEDNEKIIGFSGKIFDFGKKLSPGGIATIGGNYAIVGVNGIPIKTLLHEIGHWFGAKDVEDVSVESVMNYYSSGIEFDSENRKIVTENLGRQRFNNLKN